jgi:predicted Zn finger-like uncharacterized protein
MTSLFTQCPHCQTSFRVSGAQLTAAHGLVRCGSCLGVFSASANEIRIKHPDGYVVEELEAPDDEPDEEFPQPEPQNLTEESADFELDATEHYREDDDEYEVLYADKATFAEIADDEVEIEEEIEAIAESAASVAVAEAQPLPFPFGPEPAVFPPEKQALHTRLDSLNFDDALDPLYADELRSLDDVPVTLHHSTGFRSRAVTALLLATNLLLLLALPLPWLYVHRNELATHPRFSFLAAPVCHYLGCQQPPATVPASLYSQQLLVRSHPTEANTLEVSFVFHNDSREPQNFPRLELAFSDINNHLLANRLFKPDEYLPPELRHLSQMPAQSSVQIQLQLVDPGKEAVNYKVELYPL